MRCWTPSQSTTSRMHSRDGRSAENGELGVEGDYFEGDVGQ
jgi:hypothetical protein